MKRHLDLNHSSVDYFYATSCKNLQCMHVLSARIVSVCHRALTLFLNS